MHVIVPPGCGPGSGFRPPPRPPPQPDILITLVRCEQLGAHARAAS